MPRNRTYRRDPQAALLGMIVLSLEESGLYGKLIDMAYDRGGPVPNVPDDLCRICACDPRTLKRLLSALEKHQKITIADGQIAVRGFDSCDIFSNTSGEPLVDAAPHIDPRSGKPFADGAAHIGRRSPEDAPELDATSNDINGLPVMPRASARVHARVAATGSGSSNQQEAQAAALVIAARMGVNMTSDAQRQNWPRQANTMIAEGLDLQLDILPAVDDAKRRNRNLAEIKTLAYFKPRALELRAQRLARTTTAVPFEDTTAAGWDQRFISWLSVGWWPPEQGPMPRTGRCKAPPAQLERALAAWTAQGGHPVDGFDLAQQRFDRWDRCADRRKPGDHVDHGGAEGT